MNFPRKQIKANARAALSANYWPVVGTLFAGSVLATALIFIAVLPMYVDMFTNYLAGNYSNYQPSFEPWMIILLIVGILVCLPMSAGIQIYSYHVYRGDEPEFGDIFAAFKNGRFGKVFGGMLLVVLYLELWALLFELPALVIGSILLYTVSVPLGTIIIVVGVIAAVVVALRKSYQYSLMPYILIDRDDLGIRKSFALSKEMTNGNKWNLFVLDLSFIGWQLLSAITVDILSIFYVGPYSYLAKAGAYDYLKRTGAGATESSFESSYEANYTEQTENNDNMFEE